jgi:hypothetical protein
MIRQAWLMLPSGRQLEHADLVADDPLVPRHSCRLLASILNVCAVGVGFLVALLTQIIVFPLFGLAVSLGENLAIGGLFTVASIARSYALRRVFDAIRARPTKTGAATREYPGRPLC